MGREICVQKAKIFDDHIWINDIDGFYICGRDDFTTDLASAFCNKKESCSLLLLVPKDTYKGKEEIILGKDILLDGSSEKWDDLHTGYQSIEYIEEICDEHDAIRSGKIAEISFLIGAASVAMKHTTKLADFLEFVDYIHDLKEEIDDLYPKASNFKKMIEELKTDPEVLEGTAYISIMWSE